MRFTHNLWLFPMLVFAGACSTTRLALEPIESSHELPLTYRTGWEQGSLEAAGPGAELAAEPSEVRIRTTLVQLSTAESETLFGPIGARPAALEVAPADVERLLVSIDAQHSERLLSYGSLKLAEGKPAELRVARQCAYVAAFELSQRPGEAIADPIVQVAEDGYLLRITLRPCDESASLELAVEVVRSDLELPMREHVISLPGSAIPVTVQQPAFFTQRIQTNASLSAERALLLCSIPAREAGQTMLVVLRRE